MISKSEIKLLDIIEERKFTRRAAFGVGLLSRDANTTDKMIAWLEANPNCTEDEAIYESRRLYHEIKDTLKK